MLKLIILLLTAKLAFGYNKSFSNFFKKSMILEYEWSYIDFDWPSPEVRQQFINSGDYDFTRITPIDVDREKSLFDDGRTFVTLIRTKGVPATVNVVSKRYGPSGPLLTPYPSWEWYDARLGCDGIINVYRVAIDKCNQLWILDTGSIDLFNICPAKLLTFDLKTNTLIKKRVIPNSVAQNESGIGLLVNPLVYYEDGDLYCHRPKVFISDVIGGGLVVLNNEVFWRVTGPIFQPEPKYSYFYIAGESFYLADGMFSLAINPKKHGFTHYLAFRPHASRTLYFAEIEDVLSTQYLKPLKYSTVEDIFPSQVTMMRYSEDGTLFFHLTTETAIGCWNIKKDLIPENIGIAVQDPLRLQFSSGLKLIKHSRKETLLTLTNRFQKLMTGTRIYNEINFRILRISVKNAKSNTVCDL